MMAEKKGLGGRERGSHTYSCISVISLPLDQRYHTQAWQLIFSACFLILSSHLSREPIIPFNSSPFSSLFAYFIKLAILNLLVMFVSLIGIGACLVRGVGGLWHKGHYKVMPLLCSFLIDVMIPRINECGQWCHFLLMRVLWKIRQCKMMMG